MHIRSTIEEKEMNDYDYLFQYVKKRFEIKLNRQISDKKTLDEVIYLLRSKKRKKERKKG